MYTKHTVALLVRRQCRFKVYNLDMFFLAFLMSPHSWCAYVNRDICWCEPSWRSEILKGIELRKAADKIVLFAKKLLHVETKVVQSIHAPDVLKSPKETCDTSLVFLGNRHQ